MKPLFFDGWEVLGRTALVGVMAYVTLVVFLRVSGKRTLSKLNAFDLIVTVSLGSTLGSLVLDPDITLARGALALGLLIALQMVITWSSTRVPSIRRLVTGEPSVVFHRGRWNEAELRAVRLTKEDVRASVRASGRGSFDDIGAIVLETDGTISVVGEVHAHRTESSLEGLVGAGARASTVARPDD